MDRTCTWGDGCLAHWPDGALEEISRWPGHGGRVGQASVGQAWHLDLALEHFGDFQVGVQATAGWDFISSPTLGLVAEAFQPESPRLES